MFKIVDYEEFKSKYVHRDDCAGINWASDLECGNIVFLKETEADDTLFRRLEVSVSQILYFRIIGEVVIIQDKDFVSFYR